MKRFIDSSVYSRNRQFRLALSYKLSDTTQTQLLLPGGPKLSTFLLSCVTRIETDSWFVPGCGWQEQESLRSSVQRRRSMHDAGPNFLCPRGKIASPHQAEYISSLLNLLQQHGLPKGGLAPIQGSSTAFRWGPDMAVDWPCTVAQIWRPGNPTHDSNGGIVTIHQNRAAFFKCLHPDCQRLNKGPGIFVGYIANCDGPANISAMDAAGAQTMTRGVKRKVFKPIFNASPGHKKVTKHGTIPSTTNTSSASAADDVALASDSGCPPLSSNLSGNLRGDKDEPDQDEPDSIGNSVPAMHPSTTILRTREQSLCSIY